MIQINCVLHRIINLTILDIDLYFIKGDRGHGILFKKTPKCVDIF